MDLFALNDGFEKKSSHFIPLAERCRPTSLDEFIGHEKVIGVDSALRKEIQNSRIKSMIFWGPPGVGKTTLAKIIANEAKTEFRSISAVTSGIKDVRQIIELAERFKNLKSQRIILFIDEIHRFNKAQQDALLPAVEDGTIILIGATTENPSFEVISPLLSRLQVYQLKLLTQENIKEIVERALQSDTFLIGREIKIIDWATLVHFANGDARRALNILEKAVDSFPAQDDLLLIDKNILQKATLEKSINYDKNGDYHYDLISAFIKSIRGSDPDAAIYWLARMLEGGEDPKFIARRMIISASEDVGNADPYALTMATNCFSAIHYIGMPEARIILSQTVAYLAAAPKSNAAVLAINSAMQDVKSNTELQIPLHLRNAPTTLLAEVGYGKGYKYVHDFPGHFLQEQYLPPELDHKIYYFPSNQGKEMDILDRLRKLWEGKKNYSKNNVNKKG